MYADSGRTIDLGPSAIAAGMTDAASIIIACAILMGLVVVLFVGLWYYRKWAFSPDDATTGAAWTFEDLRQMRDRGDLSEDEYQSLRAAMLGSYGASGPNAPPDRGDAASHTIAGPSADDQHGDFDMEKDPNG